MGGGQRLRLPQVHPRRGAGRGGDPGPGPGAARLAEDPERVWSLLRGATWWLPLSEPFLFRGLLPNENTAVLGTTAGLRIELEWLNRSLWRALNFAEEQKAPILLDY